MKDHRLKILIAILLVAVVGLNYWNNTRPDIEYIHIDSIVSELIYLMDDMIDYNCTTRGYVKVNDKTFICIQIDSINSPDLML